MSPLRTLLQQSSAPNTPVALRRRPASASAAPARIEEIPRNRFRADVADLRDRVSAGREGGWLLFCEDAYAFAVGLFALWHAGRHALLPPNQQPQTLEALERRAAGVLTDDIAWCDAGRALCPLAGPDARPWEDELRFEALAPEALAVELYTSGTTGDAKAVTKRVRHLDDEVRELSRCFGALLDGTTLFSTASHQHLYGLLFGLLWPLEAGRPFFAHHFLHIGEVLAPMQDTERCVLASVPTTLRRLARHEAAAHLRERCVAVFSSGGPLALETAHEVAERVGRAPIEILGSTETGGIAWRQQREPFHPDRPQDWTPLPAVSIEREATRGELCVHSPFVSVEGGPLGYATGDRISLRAEGRFAMQGRLDQTVKVGEKRLDLDQMATFLREHPAVEDAALLTLDREGEARVAAVVTPSQTGWGLLDGETGEYLRQSLRAHLALRFDPVVLPRAWRFLPEVPTTTQGKVSRVALEAHFRPLEADATGGDRPEVLEEQIGRDFVERACRVPRDLHCFPGHFPGKPVVPGALQLGWAMELVQQMLGGSARAREVESLKLMSPLTPGQHFRVRSCLRTAETVEFRVWSRDAVHATGRVRLSGVSGPAR